MKIPSTNQIKKMSQEQIDKFTSEGLAEVCEGLAKYKETSPKQKKQFLKYADTFRKLGQICDVKPKKSRRLK